MTAPKHALQRKLLDGLRYLLDGRPRPAEILAPKDEDEPLEFDDQIENFMDYGG